MAIFKFAVLFLVLATSGVLSVPVELSPSASDSLRDGRSPLNPEPKQLVEGSPLTAPLTARSAADPADPDLQTAETFIGVGLGGYGFGYGGLYGGFGYPYYGGYGYGYGYPGLYGRYWG